MGSRRSARRALLARAIALLGLPAVGCSLLIPLDYTGGTPGAGAGNAGVAGYLPPVTGGSSGQGGSGGSGPRGGSNGQGGKGGSVTSGGKGGSGDEGPGGEAGTGASGGMQSSGGAAPLGGEAGEAGMAGADGGTAGAQVGKGGTAGVGGTAGMGGTAGVGGTAGMGGTAGSSGRGGNGGAGACPGVDLETDRDHCGSCTHACLPSSDCIGGICIDSPCEGLCAPAVEVPLKNTTGDGYYVENIGTAATCHQVSTYDPAPKLPSIISWEFVTARTLKVNGVAVAVMKEPGALLDMPRRAGGYCIQASAGLNDYAGYKLPLPGTR